MIIVKDSYGKEYKIADDLAFKFLLDNQVIDIGYYKFRYCSQKNGSKFIFVDCDPYSIEDINKNLRYIAWHQSYSTISGKCSLLIDYTSLKGYKSHNPETKQNIKFRPISNYIGKAFKVLGFENNRCPLYKYRMYRFNDVDVADISIVEQIFALLTNSLYNEYKEFNPPVEEEDTPADYSGPKRECRDIKQISIRREFIGDIEIIEKLNNILSYDIYSYYGGKSEEYYPSQFDEY